MAGKPSLHLRRKAKPLTTDSLWDAVQYNTSWRGTALDLTGYSLAWQDDFNTQNIAQDTYRVATAPAGTKWFSPAHPASNSNGWAGPDSVENPYSVADSALTIRLHKGAADKWWGGNIQSVDKDGAGFVQTLGYWEMRAKFPLGNGTWPAFWLYTVNRYNDLTQTTFEIDIVEAYGAPGGNQYAHHATLHLRQRTPPVPGTITVAQHKGVITTLATDMFDGNYHTYGCKVTVDWVIFYVDGVEITRVKSFVEALYPKYHLVDIGPNDEVDPFVTDGPFDMVVDYVKIWAPTP